VVLGEHALNGLQQRVITLRPGRPACRIELMLRMAAIARRGDLQHGADRLAPVRGAMRVDESVHHAVGCIAKRSSSAEAKNALALRMILFARFRSRFFRSSAFNRTRSSVVIPRGFPESRSAWRTHNRSVSAEQPIFSAMDRIASDCVSHACRWSSTSRTCRSRTSSENGFAGRFPALCLSSCS